MRFNKYGIIIPLKQKRISLLPNNGHYMILDEMDRLGWVQPQTVIHHYNNQRIIRGMNERQRIKFNRITYGRI